MPLDTDKACPVAKGHRDSIQQEMLKRYLSDLLGELCLLVSVARFNTRSIIWLLFQAHAFENDSFLRNGRHGGVQHVQQKKSEYEIFMKREKIYLTFTFKGWFSSAILNFLFKNQTNCYWWFAFCNMLITMTMTMSNILSSCLDLRYPKPDPNPTRNPDF